MLFSEINCHNDSINSVSYNLIASYIKKIPSFPESKKDLKDQNESLDLDFEKINIDSD